MLRPIRTETREALTLDGLWSFCPDPNGKGDELGWWRGLPAGKRSIAVPGSWNEQGVDCSERDLIGTAWYETEFLSPSKPMCNQVCLRMDAVFRRARIWLNGFPVGDLDIPFLPFFADITEHLSENGRNRLIIRVNNTVSPDDLLSGYTSPWKVPPIGVGQVPWVNFDWYPFGGIHGSVWLLTLPEQRFENVWVETLSLSMRLASVRVHWALNGKMVNGRVNVSILAEKRSIVSKSVSFSDDTILLDVAQPRPWSPESRFLYEAEFELMNEEGHLLDAYRLSVGIRTVSVRKGRLLLNGRRIFLRGVGRHEDFPVVGKGALAALAVRDNRILHWLGANSFRTTHYPCHEDSLDLADRTGIMVIGEAPANGISLDGSRNSPQKLWPQHRKTIEAMIERDGNHPSVIMWSVANEPQTQHKAAGAYFRKVFAHTRKLDPLRPVTAVTYRGNWVVSSGHEPEYVNRLADVVCINRYFGWYSHYGRLPEAMEALDNDLESLRRLGKPVILTEFGAECLPGLHDTADRQFTEEYQAELLVKTIQVAEKKPFVAGVHVWCLADFMTPQNVSRVLGNHKGVFTRTREPKRAAWVLRELWSHAKQDK